MAWFRCIGGSGGGGGTKTPYIASWGGQYFKLPFYGNEDIVIKTSIIVPAVTTVQNFIGTIWSSSGIDFHCEAGYLKFRYAGGLASFNNIPWEPINIEYKTSPNTLIYNGVTYGGSGTQSNAVQIQMFGLDSNRYAICAMSTIEIYKDGTLSARLVPQKDNSDNGYFHDDINNLDYYSLTSTNFIYIEA